jgi:hypothetical protein
MAHLKFKMWAASAPVHWILVWSDAQQIKRGQKRSSKNACTLTITFTTTPIIQRLQGRADGSSWRCACTTLICVGTCTMLVRAQCWYVYNVDMCTMLIRAQCWYVHNVDTCTMLIHLHSERPAAECCQGPSFVRTQKCPVGLPEPVWCKKWST